MNLELIKKVYDMHTRGFGELDFNIIKKDNYEIIYSSQIRDCYCNFISGFDAKNKEELEEIVVDAKKNFKELDRSLTICLTPIMKELYLNKDTLLQNDKYEKISNESWMIFDDWNNIDKIESKCEDKVTLELTDDLELYSDCIMDCYKTDDEDDPYGDIDNGYRQAYLDFKGKNQNITNNFYFIKINDEIVGTTQETFDNEVYGIYGLAIKKEYRNKKIGREVLRQQLEMCKSKNIKTAYLMTEADYYPNKLYEKIGFKDLCKVYYYKVK